MFEHLRRVRLLSGALLLSLLVLSVALPLFWQDQEWLARLVLLRTSAEQNQWNAWLWFSLAVFVSQLLIVPSGSVLMLFGGFMLGAPAATLIFSIVQILTTGLLVWLGRKSGIERLHQSLSRWSGLVETTFKALDRVPLTLGIVLRLFPVLPSAVACLLSVVFTIPLRIFLFATFLVGWIRPLLFASAGALLPSVLAIEASQSDTAVSVLWPASLLFFSALMLLAVRIWLTGKTDNDSGS